VITKSSPKIYGYTVRAGIYGYMVRAVDGRGRLIGETKKASREALASISAVNPERLLDFERA